MHLNPDEKRAVTMDMDVDSPGSDQAAKLKALANSKEAAENGVEEDTPKNNGAEHALCNGEGDTESERREEEDMEEEEESNGEEEEEEKGLNGTEKCNGETEEEVKENGTKDEEEEKEESKEEEVKEELDSGDEKEDSEEKKAGDDPVKEEPEQSESEKDKVNSEDKTANGEDKDEKKDCDVKDEVKEEAMEVQGEQKDEVKDEVEKKTDKEEKDVKEEVSSADKEDSKEEGKEEKSSEKTDEADGSQSEQTTPGATPAVSKEGTPVPEEHKVQKEAKYKLFEQCGTDTEEMRPMAKLLYALGADLCKQMIFKDLIRINEKKKSQNKLEDYEVNQLNDLVKVHSGLSGKNEPYALDSTTCSRCAFKSESTNIIEWHKEFAHNQEDGLYSCSFCDFESKFPGQFFYHMEAIHNRKGRIYMRPSFFNCPMCPFENSTKAALKKHLMKCEKTFTLKRNLEPAPTDCDIPLKKAKTAQPKKPPPKPIQPQVTQKPLPPLRPSRPAVPSAKPAVSPALARQQQTMQQQFQALAQRMGAPGITMLPQTNMSQPPSYAIGNQVFTLVNSAGQFMLQPTGATVPGFPGMGVRPGMPLMNQAMMAQQAAAVNQAMLQLQVQHAAAAKAKAKQQSQTAVASKPKSTPPPKPTPPKSTSSPSSGKSTKSSQFEICEICGGFVKDRESLRIHFYWAHKVDINKEIFERKEPHLACNACPQRFWTYQGYRWHQRMKHNNTSMPEQQPGAPKPSPKYFCAVCRSHTITNLLLHLYQVHKITVDMVCEQKRCPMCGVTFKNSSNTRMHLYNSHKEMFKEAPVLEGKKSPLKGPLSAQAKAAAAAAQASPVPTGLFENSASRQAKFEPVCSICDLTFPNVEAFTLHCNRNHVFNCYRCSSKWSTAEQLSNHFNREHRFEQERCQLCNDKVTIGRPYIRHVKRTHLKELQVPVQRLSPKIQKNIMERYARQDAERRERLAAMRSPTGLNPKANLIRKMGPKSKTQPRPDDGPILIDDDEEPKPVARKSRKSTPTRIEPREVKDVKDDDEEDEDGLLSDKEKEKEKVSSDAAEEKETPPDQETMEVDGETIIIQKQDDE